MFSDTAPLNRELVDWAEASCVIKARVSLTNTSQHTIGNIPLAKAKANLCQDICSRHGLLEKEGKFIFFIYHLLSQA